jgi:plastocyanin
MKFNNLQSLTKKFDKKLTILVVLSVVVIAGLLVFLVIHNNAGNNSKHAEEAPNPGYKQTEDELADHKQQVQVNITADGPQPQTLRVQPDTLIGWRNSDSKAHELAISPGTKVPDKFYNFRTLDPSGGYQFVIHQTGTFHYYDVTTPTLTGEIIVSAR